MNLNLIWQNTVFGADKVKLNLRDVIKLYFNTAKEIKKHI